LIVAIVKQTSPVGSVKPRQFREAISTAQALTDFVNSYTPPLNPADWLSVDTGWSSVQYPPPGRAWAWDFATSALVLISNPGGLKQFQGFAKTLTLAPTVLLKIPTNDNVTYAVEVRVAARRLDVGKAFGKRAAVTLRRNTGVGSLITVGTTVLYAHLEAPITWTADVVPNLVTGDIEVVVVGAPTAPVDWWAYADVIEV